ncbi:MAG TPA: discoidin domain-containing protein, partial [Armatimonadota bacterium]|nr:discoidin domain-containing protein [Armatimonadota bacterium]
MHRTLLAFILLALTCLPVAGQDASTNLATTEWAIPSAVSSAPEMAYTAPKATDGKLDTGWVSSDEGYPQWLRVEGRFAFEAREVTFRQFPGCAVEGVGGIGRYAVEALQDGQWERLASGDATGKPADAVVRVPLPKPVTTRAIRLVIESGAARRVAVTEFQVLGPKPIL